MPENKNKAHSRQLDNFVQLNSEKIRANIGDMRPRLALILGSGLGNFANWISTQGYKTTRFAYEDLQGFPITGVEGHAGALFFVRLQHADIVIISGRIHYYEQGDASAMLPVIATCKALGVNTLLVTNAAGALDPQARPGDLMLIRDHINMTGTSPLIGQVGNARFVNMTDAYDPDLCEKIKKLAYENAITLHEGTYLWATGPQFETPAEIRAFRILGADAVGMSTVPEVILARHQGLKVAGLSILTNMAAGMRKEVLSHAQTQSCAESAADKVRTLLMALFEEGG